MRSAYATRHKTNHKGDRQMKRQTKQQTAKRYEVREMEEYGITVYKVWDTQYDRYTYGTCEYLWACAECNKLNG
jgi:hypothetical protein